jgi:hypothetical protein
VRHGVAALPFVAAQLDGIFSYVPLNSAALCRGCMRFVMDTSASEAVLVYKPGCNPLIFAGRNRTVYKLSY